MMRFSQLGIFNFEARTSVITRPYDSIVKFVIGWFDFGSLKRILTQIELSPSLVFLSF